MFGPPSGSPYARLKLRIYEMWVCSQLTYGLEVEKLDDDTVRKLNDSKFRITFSETENYQTTVPLRTSDNPPRILGHYNPHTRARTHTYI